MGGPGGLTPLSFRLWSVILLATQVAFAVSPEAIKDRQNGFRAMDSGNCQKAVTDLLKAHGEGDSSNALMLRLSQALECDDRMVDALSATYADNKVDTAGRIELVLYRAQLLRKIGLGEEAAQVEKALGDEFVTQPVHLEDEPLVPTVHWSMGGSGGWMYQGISSRMADSFSILRFSALVLHTTASQDSALGAAKQKALEQFTGDSVVFAGGQFPVTSQFAMQLFLGDAFLGFQVPVQVIFDQELKTWLSADWRQIAQVGGSVNCKGVDLTGQVSAGWTTVMYPGQESGDFQDYSAYLEAKKNWSWLSLVQSNSANLAFQDGSTFLNATGNHSLTASRPLFWGIQGTLGGGFGWLIDRNREEFGVFTDRTTRTVDVRGAGLGVENKDSMKIQFLGKEGNPLTYNRIQRADVLRGLFPGQSVQVQDGFQYPVDSRGDWNRWNAQGSLSKVLPGNVTVQLGLDYAQTNWLHDQNILVGDLDSVYNESDLSSGEVLLYRDANSGIAYWVMNPLRSLMAPIALRRPRVDQTWTLSASLTSQVSKRMAVQLQWTWIRNISNLEHVVDGSSYTRSIWNASTSVSW